jgi:tRNA threonylcarbamoyladenosine biosynthesis protein TsaE
MANANPNCDDVFTAGVRIFPDAAALIAFGRQVGERITVPRVICLDGPLGAGKTHFVKGLVQGLGSVAEVSSPTFTLVHEYLDGRLPVVHLDFYRLTHADEVVALGWDDYFDGESVIAVEWGSRFPELIPSDALLVELKIIDQGREVRLGGKW